MFVDVTHIKFWILDYVRNHRSQYPTVMQLLKFINESNDANKTKKVYHRIELVKILRLAKERGILFKEEKTKEGTVYKIRAEAMPAKRKVVKEIKVWDGKMEKWGKEEEGEEIWEPDNPGKSKDFWDGSRENIWKVEVTD